MLLLLLLVVDGVNSGQKEEKYDKTKTMIRITIRTFPDLTELNSPNWVCKRCFYFGFCEFHWFLTLLSRTKYSNSPKTLLKRSSLFLPLPFLYLSFSFSFFFFLTNLTLELIHSLIMQLQLQQRHLC